MQNAFFSLQIQLQISHLDPADFSEYCAENQSQDSWKKEAYQKNSQPHIYAAAHGSVNSDGANQPAGSHTGSGSNILQAEQACSNRACNHGGQCGGYPDPGVLNNISHLQHRCAKTLG